MIEEDNTSHQNDIEKSIDRPEEEVHRYARHPDTSDHHDFSNQTEIDEFFTHSRFAALKVILLVALAIIAFVLWAFW